MAKVGFQWGLFLMHANCWESRIDFRDLCNLFVILLLLLPEVFKGSIPDSLDSGLLIAESCYKGNIKCRFPNLVGEGPTLGRIYCSDFFRRATKLRTSFLVRGECCKQVLLVYC